MLHPLLEARGVGRKLGPKWLLHPVTLSISPGQRLTLQGPSGSGKTLLLRCLAMLDPCDVGEIYWSGNQVRGGFVPRFRGHVIYLHQRPVLFEGTVLDNLQQPFALHVHRGSHFDRSRIVKLLAAVERPENLLNQPAQELSGGESQLVALLRAIQLNPEVLLLDEPTAALDADATRMVEQIVSNWCAGGERPRALVWVTHDPQQAVRVGGTMYRLRNGELGPAEEHP